MGPSWAQKPFFVPRFLFVGKRLRPPRPSPRSKGQTLAVSNYGREEMQKQRKNTQEIVVQPWGRVLVPPQGMPRKYLWALLQEPRHHPGCCCCSVAQLCPTLWDPVDHTTPGFSVLHHLLELAQTHVHWVSDVIQPSHPLSPPSPLAFYLSQHQGLFQ